MYGQKRVEGGVGQSREPKLTVCCLRTSAHPFLAKNRPGAPIFGHCPLFQHKWFVVVVITQHLRIEDVLRRWLCTRKIRKQYLVGYNCGGRLALSMHHFRRGF